NAVADLPVGDPEPVVCLDQVRLPGSRSQLLGDVSLEPLAGQPAAEDRPMETVALLAQSPVAILALRDLEDVAGSRPLRAKRVLEQERPRAGEARANERVADRVGRPAFGGRL